jgi:L-ascorbate metabolism protein UlaG (beta-lactamase superfamily)
MNDEKFFLKQNVMMEPLLNQWCVYPFLIPPPSAAMTITNVHVKVMKSFVMAPNIHAEAIKNPAMRGGLFLNLPPKRVGEVKDLLNRTLSAQAQMIELAGAIKSLNEMILAEAKGFCLEDLYEKVPRPLKGYVELFYDLNNTPGCRYIEGLLYCSPFYDVSLQAMALSLVNSDDRAFGLSTPRFEDEQTLIMNIPFERRGIDDLFAMRHTPRTFDYIKDRLALDDRHDEKFKKLLTTEPPRRAPRYEGDSIRVRYFNHACLLIETKDVSILTDPIVSYEYPVDLPRYTYADLPDVINYALITHGHGDHLLLETLLQLRHKIETIVVPRTGGGSLEDPSLKLILKNIGFNNVIEIDEMESIGIRGGSITGLPFLGEHADLNVRGKIAYFIRLLGRSILCAADSRNVEFELYEKVHRVIGDIDALYLGMECDGAPLMWLYGQFFTKPVKREDDQSRRLSGSDYVRAIDIVDKLRCKQVYVYAMGQEPWLHYLTSILYTEESKPIVESDKLVEACRNRGRISERLFCTKEMFM